MTLRLGDELTVAEVDPARGLLVRRACGCRDRYARCLAQTTRLAERSLRAGDRLTVHRAPVPNGDLLTRGPGERLYLLYGWQPARVCPACIVVG